MIKNFFFIEARPTPEIPATQEGGIHRIAVPGQHREKVSETPFQQQTRHGDRLL
jgi:hypothetical protein